MTAITAPLDGRITSQNVLAGPLVGTEVMEIVSPGNAAEGNTYQVLTSILGAYAAAFPYVNSTEVTAGAAYASCNTDTVILVNKTVGSSTTITMLQAAAMLLPGPVLIKDQKGDAGTHNIVINFTGENCDGASSITIAVNYGFCFIVPVPGGGAWYMTSRLLV